MCMCLPIRFLIVMWIPCCRCAWPHLFLGVETESCIGVEVDTVGGVGVLRFGMASLTLAGAKKSNDGRTDETRKTTQCDAVLRATHGGGVYLERRRESTLESLQWIQGSSPQTSYKCADKCSFGQKCFFFLLLSFLSTFKTLYVFKMSFSQEGNMQKIPGRFKKNIKPNLLAGCWARRLLGQPWRHGRIGKLEPVGLFSADLAE